MDNATPSPAPTTGLSLYAGIVTDRFVATCEFYFENFAFTPLEISEDYALLGHAAGARLGILRAAGDGQPAVLQKASRGGGIWIALEVDDPDAMHDRLRLRGVEVVADPEYTVSGVRRCVVRDPNGVLIYLIGRSSAAAPSPTHNLHKHHDQDHCRSIHGISRH